jgi:chromosome partitioning protein
MGHLMKTLAIISQKGGSGKSTLAVHLAAYARSNNLQPAIVDLDPQGSSFQWNSLRRENDPKSPKLEATRSTADKLATLQRIGIESGVDLLIVDTAPHSDRSAALAAQLADGVLVPCRPSLFDLNAVASTFQIIAAANKPAAVVLNAAPRGKLADEAREALENQGIKVLPTVIQQRAAYSHAVIDGRAVHEYEPDGKAAQEIASLYQDIARFIAITQRRNNARAREVRA